MPYITSHQRIKLDGALESVKAAGLIWHEMRAGDLAYLLYRICGSWLGPNRRYERIATMIGVLETVRAELQARIIRPYEEVRLAENGDVQFIGPDKGPYKKH